MNTRLLRKIAAKVLEFPHSFDMENWGETVPADSRHPCGTVACIAGNAVLLATSREEFESVCMAAISGWCSSFSQEPFAVAGAKALSLNEDEARRLFVLDNWPPELFERYERAARASTKARILNERIELFIKTKGEK